MERPRLQVILQVGVVAATGGWVQVFRVNLTTRNQLSIMTSSRTSCSVVPAFLSPRRFMSDESMPQPQFGTGDARCLLTGACAESVSQLLRIAWRDVVVPPREDRSTVWSGGIRCERKLESTPATERSSTRWDRVSTHSAARSELGALVVPWKPRERDSALWSVSAEAGM